VYFPQVVLPLTDLIRKKEWQIGQVTVAPNTTIDMPIAIKMSSENRYVLAQANFVYDHPPKATRNIPVTQRPFSIVKPWPTETKGPGSSSSASAPSKAETNEDNKEDKVRWVKRLKMRRPKQKGSHSSTARTTQKIWEDKWEEKAGTEIPEKTECRHAKELKKKFDSYPAHLGAERVFAIPTESQGDKSSKPNVRSTSAKVTDAAGLPSLPGVEGPAR
jgi:hypothetical protein